MNIRQAATPLPMKYYPFLLTVLLLTGQKLTAQTDFRPAYFLSLSGDTVHGEIDYRGDLTMSELCKFRGADGKVRDYAPYEIAGYRFIDSKNYVSKEVNQKSYFLEFLIKGRVNIYYLRDETGRDRYFLDHDNQSLVEIPYQSTIKSINYKTYFIESKDHIAVLQEHMQDAPALQEKITKFKKPEHQNLIRIAEEYHQTVCKDEPCIVFRKDLPLLKLSLEAMVGIGIIESTERIPYFQAGIITRFWLPRANEKLYLRTGFLVSNFDNKTPFQIEYIYPRGNIRPGFAYGYNFYYNYSALIVAMNPGVKIKLNSSLHLNVGTEFEFSPVRVILPVPERLVGYSLNLGLIYKL